LTTLRLRSDKLQWLETDGQVIALDEESLVYLSANHAGTVLWDELARGTTRESLVERIVESFGIDAAEAARDVDAFLAQLEARGLLAD
jgi:Coenzyme PQQ synthesis protein D (PqqD)